MAWGSSAYLYADPVFRYWVAQTTKGVAIEGVSRQEELKVDASPIEINWLGPFGWPGFGDTSDILPNTPGIYLWTAEYLQGGYLIYAAGITRRPMKKRFSEHTRAYLNGTYTLFDMDALRQGVRKEVWHGFWTKKRSAERQQEFDRRRSELDAAARAQLAAFQIFVATVDPQPRLLERLEAAIMNCLYNQAAPLSDIPDRWMMLAPRWPAEAPLTIGSNSQAVLHGLPQIMLI